MSEKKTTSKKVHTLTLEDQTKLAQANVKKMEQGKIEVMKVVEGVQGAEKLAELIERGKKNGKLSSSELMDVLENLDLESDQMDKIYDTLENLGIDTVGDDYLPELADDIMPPLEELNEIEELPEEVFLSIDFWRKKLSIDGFPSRIVSIDIPASEEGAEWR